MRKLVLLFILINSLIFTFVVPPFQKPDENVKFYRTVALADGQLFCHVNDKGEKVLSIPRKYYELPILFKTDEIKNNSDRKFSVNISDLRTQLNKLGHEAIETSKGCISYFVGFIPNTIGFLIGAPFNDPLIQFYLGRIAGLVLFLLVFGYAVKIIPQPFQIILYLYGILPMILHQVTAYNEDVLFFSMVPLVFSYFVKVYFEKITVQKDFYFYQISILILVLSKPIAVPFIFLHLLLPSQILSNKKNNFLVAAFLFFLVSIFGGLYFYYLKR